MTLDSLPRSPQEVRASCNQFDLGPFRDHFEELRVLKLEADTAVKRYELYRNRLKARAGQADELVLDGIVVATHAISGAFNKARFEKEQPAIFEDYLVTREVQVFDEERFAKDHPSLYESDAYRARSLRFKS